MAGEARLRMNIMVAAPQIFGVAIFVKTATSFTHLFTQSQLALHMRHPTYSDVTNLDIRIFEGVSRVLQCDCSVIKYGYHADLSSNFCRVITESTELHTSLVISESQESFCGVSLAVHACNQIYAYIGI